MLKFYRVDRKWCILKMNYFFSTASYFNFVGVRLVWWYPKIWKLSKRKSRLRITYHEPRSLETPNILSKNDCLNGEIDDIFVPWAEVVGISKHPISRITVIMEKSMTFVPWAKVVGKSKPLIQKWVKMEKLTTYFVPWAETVGKSNS